MFVGLFNTTAVVMCIPIGSHPFIWDRLQLTQKPTEEKQYRKGRTNNTYVTYSKQDVPSLTVESFFVSFEGGEGLSS